MKEKMEKEKGKKAPLPAPPPPATRRSAATELHRSRPRPASAAPPTTSPSRAHDALSSCDADRPPRALLPCTRDRTSSRPRTTRAVTAHARPSLLSPALHTPPQTESRATQPSPRPALRAAPPEALLRPVTPSSTRRARRPSVPVTAPDRDAAPAHVARPRTSPSPRPSSPLTPL